MDGRDNRYERLIYDATREDFDIGDDVDSYFDNTGGLNFKKPPNPKAQGFFDLLKPFKDHIGLARLY